MPQTSRGYKTFAQPQASQGPYVAPSILSANFLELQSELDSIATADFVHFDVMDGSFVPNLSFGLPILKQVKGATELPLDVHLMIQNPDEMALAYADAGADIVCFHQEAATHAHRIISALHEKGVSAGMALNPATAVSTLDAIVCELDLILVMSVNPGFGGQSFIPQTLDKLREVRALCERKGVNPLIEVDGGVSAANAEEICHCGANMLVAGSAVFKGEPKERIEEIRAAGTAGLTQALLGGVVQEA